MTVANRTPSTEEALAFAVRSAERADMETARAALRWVLRREPDNVAALMWLHRCSEDPEAASHCRAKVAELNPMMASA